MGECGMTGADGSVAGERVNTPGAGMNARDTGVNAPGASVNAPDDGLNTVDDYASPLPSIWADGTWSGTLFWDSALYLSQMLLSPMSTDGGRWRRKIQRGGAVLELGCGLGLPGFVSHLLGAEAVLLTDRPRIVNLVREAIAGDEGLRAAAALPAHLGSGAAAASNSGSIPALAALPFSWDETAAAALLNQELGGRAPSVILACDCIFAPLFGESFLLLRMLLALAALPAAPAPLVPPTAPSDDTPLSRPPNGTLPPGPPDGTLVLLSLERRPGDGADAFFAQAARAGFETTVARREGRVLICEMVRRQ